LTSTIGKIFFAVVAKRLEKYMTQNKFISQVQKGFKAETPGCLEHSFAMYEALLDAKLNQRQIVVAWLDLCNAYGSVKHNLVQFALEWYHVPDMIRELILDYYDKICAQIRTKEWTSDIFKFDIGLFQGCVLSCILFNCVFQLLLDMVSPLGAENGYTFKDTSLVLHDQAFADDVSFISSTPEKMQGTINEFGKGLDWARLKAKPQKCVGMAMKKFDPRNEHKVEFQRFGETVYCPYDPNLQIAGKKIRFIVNTEADPESLQSDHFKELGRWISVSLNEEKMKAEIAKRVSENLETIEGSGVNGLSKLFLYEHFLVSKLSWVFLVHDLSSSFAESIDKKVIPRLKSWAGLFRSSDLGTLFRRREHLGLQLTSITLCYKHMQLVKCCLLQNSSDPKVRKDRVTSFTARWSGPKALEQLIPIAEHNLKFAGQVGTSGLGASKSASYIGTPTLRDLRENVTKALAAECEEAHLQHAACLPLQGVWTHWIDTAQPFDLSWQNLITATPSLISFVLNAQINSVRTPDMLRLWGYKKTAACPLCNAPQCTLHHILVNCDFALKQKRYTWRHDSVLKNIEISLMSLVKDFNRKMPTSLVKATRKEFEACFVRKGESKKSGSQKPECVSQSVLECANDWKLLVDFDSKKAEFPPAILATPLRPDIVLWSQMSRVVVLIELTCCAEEGMSAARLRKETKYTELVSEINGTKIWKASLFTLEIGARGLVGLSTHKTFVRLGFTSSQAKALCKKLSSVVARCSYAVYQAHNNLAWSHGTDLIVAEGSSAGSGRAQASTTVEVAGSVPTSTLEEEEPPCNNVKVLRDHGIKSLFHFTDVSNLESIRKNGLLTWKKLVEQKIPARMNSSGLSHNLDASKGLADYVRLSFCKKHPMMYISLKEERISTPVVLEIKLEAVSRPGVLFCEINAAAKAAKASANPAVIRFEVVKACSQRDVDQSLRPFYQGEVLVPEWIPPHLIKIPNVDAFNRPLELRGRLPDSNLVECTLKGQVEVKASKPSSTSCNIYPIAAGAGSSTPEPHPIEVRSTGNGNGSHETFAPKTLGKPREVP
jgi:hypothetical protein